MRIKTGFVVCLGVWVSLLCCNASQAAIVFSDSFTYPDGALTTVSGGTWANHSGTAGQVNVVSGQTHLTEAESEDVNAAISGGPYTSGLLYAGLDFNFTSLPQGVGQYFFHFKDATTSGFRGRVFATVTDAAPGFYRIGITNGSNSGVVTVPVDLALNTPHRLVLSLDTGTTPVSTLYLDSPTETGGTVATDVVTALPITSIALRQSSTSGPTTMGILDVDNLVVSTSYGDAAVVPEPAALGLLSSCVLALSRRKRRA
jgi:hypothetical protein